LSATAGRAAGGFVGGIANNPGIVAIAGIAITVISLLLIFRKDITNFFENFGQVELPTIEFPEFPDINIEFPDITFPEFPDITFPEFPDFSDLFDFFGGGPPPEPVDIPPGPVAPPGTPPGPGTTTEFPPGCTFDPVTGIIDCPEGGPTFDACAEFPDLPQCQPDQPPIGGGPVDEVPSGPELPPGFEGGGISFEGGTVFERDPCFMTLNEIIEAGLANSASAAANLRAEACSANVTEEPSDFPPGFDFGTNVGDSSLAEQEKIAACTSCELFGLNCPICKGEIGA